MNLKTALPMLLAAVFAGSGLTLSAAPASATAPEKQEKILIAFYSWSDNTRAAAKQIQQKIGGDLFDIKPVKPYPAGYKATVAQAKKEINANFAPPLATSADLSQYEIIFIGSPNWWGTIAPPVLSFIQGHNLKGKTVIPFITHGSGGMQRCEADLKKYCEAADAECILKCGAFYGSQTHAPLPALVKWAEDSLNAAKAEKMKKATEKK